MLQSRKYRSPNSHCGTKEGKYVSGTLSFSMLMFHRKQTIKVISKNLSADYLIMIEECSTIIWDYGRCHLDAVTKFETWHGAHLQSQHVGGLAGLVAQI